MNLRKLAKGRECQVRIPSVCNGNPETTVLAHYSMAGVSGKGLKSPDILGAWCCSACCDRIYHRQCLGMHCAGTKEFQAARIASIESRHALDQEVIAGLQKLNAECHALHLERTKLTERVIAERDALRASQPPQDVRMTEPLALTGFAERQLVAIDASVFSGDTYASEEGRARFAWYMGRWCRELELVPGVQPVLTKSATQAPQCSSLCHPSELCMLIVDGKCDAQPTATKGDGQ